MVTESREGALAAITRMGSVCCSYSWGGVWAERCDCKYGVVIVQKWPTPTEKGNGCPELRSLHTVISEMTDDEWALLVQRAGGVPRGHLFDDDVGSRLHRAEAAARMAAANIENVRAELGGESA